MSSQYLAAYSPFCPIDKREIIDHTYTCITKTFVLFDRHVNFTGSRDPCDQRFFLLTQKNIYQSGKREVISLRLTEREVNDLFYRLDNLDTRNSINKILYIC